jgi:hypothetical protein
MPVSFEILTECITRIASCTSLHWQCWFWTWCFMTTARWFQNFIHVSMSVNTALKNLSNRGAHLKIIGFNILPLQVTWFCMHRVTQNVPTNFKVPTIPRSNVIPSCKTQPDPIAQNRYFAFCLNILGRMSLLWTTKEAAVIGLRVCLISALMNGFCGVALKTELPEQPKGFGRAECHRLLFDLQQKFSTVWYWILGCCCEKL